MKVLFLFNEYPLHNHILESYLRARPSDTVSLVKVGLVLKGKSRSETAQRILPQLSKRFIWNKMNEFLINSLITVIPKLLNRGAVFKRLRTIARRNRLPFHRTDNLMAEETLKFIRDQQPNLIVTLVHQIIKKELLAIPTHGVINIHPGILPDFRGIQPYFWELSESFGEGGVTIHYISDETVDTGAIVGQERFKTFSGMSVQLNYYLTAKAAGELVPKVITKLEEGSLSPIPQDPGKGAYFKWPDTAAVNRLYRAGHKIVSLRDLAGILTGKYDGVLQPRGLPASARPERQ